MTGGTISGCTAKTGGGFLARGQLLRDTPYALVDVLVTNCHATGDQDDDGGGGILVEGGVLLTMTGGAVRDCATQSYGGRHRVTGAFDGRKIQALLKEFIGDRRIEDCTDPTLSLSVANLSAGRTETARYETARSETARGA